MLKHHKYFLSTPIPEKNLKSAKTPFGAIFDIFWSFLLKGDFSKKIRVLSHTFPYGPLTPYKASEKTNEPIPRKLLERRTDRQTDEQTDGRTDLNSYYPSGCSQESKNHT